MDYNLKLDYMKKELLVIRNLSYYGEYPNCFALITHHALKHNTCLLYTSPSPRDAHESRMPSSA